MAPRCFANNPGSVLVFLPRPWKRRLPLYFQNIDFFHFPYMRCFAEPISPRGSVSCDTCVHACLFVRLLFYQVPQFVANAGPTNDRCECYYLPSSSYCCLLSGSLLNPIVPFLGENGSLSIQAVPNACRLQLPGLKSSSFLQATREGGHGQHCGQALLK